ncbi:MAG: flagellar biosynthesis protein FlhF [Candidatus Hydrogenedentes bacterium]|nr:flagellar biosynthesis protein FlhF [Candidatus Hydrogenedentota bacterium]
MTQVFQKVRGRTLEEAYRKMRQDYGPDAVVISTSQVSEGGLLGWFGRKVVELTASVPGQVLPARALSQAEKKYADAGAAGGAHREETIQMFEQIVRDAQKRMNAPASAEGPARKEVTGDAPARAAAAGAAPVLPFPKKKQDAQQAAETLSREVQEIREMMQVLYAESPGAGLPAEFAPHYRTLVDRGVSRKVAAALIGAVVKNSDIAVIREPRVFVERLHYEIRKLIQVSGGIQLTPGACRVVALCGPTGVGKTTNLAKLAAHFAVHERLRVGMITTDNYRIAAPEQLRVYANIIGLPIRVATNPKELQEGLYAFREFDLVLMDTAGGSQFNLEQIRELQHALLCAKPHEILLVMSASTQLSDLRNIVSNFSCVRPTAVVFTKLDETSQYGGLFSMVMEAGLKLSYFSIGQNVPDDIRVATPAMVAKLILEGRNSRG